MLVTSGRATGDKYQRSDIENAVFGAFGVQNCVLHREGQGFESLAAQSRKLMKTNNLQLPTELVTLLFLTFYRGHWPRNGMIWTCPGSQESPHIVVELSHPVALPT